MTSIRSTRGEEVTIHRFHSSPEDAGMRLDQFLARQLPEFSRTQLRKIIDLGGSYLDGRRCRRCSQTIPATKDGTDSGVAIELHLDGGPLEPYRITESDIIFEDKYLLVLNKPAGINTQPTPARYQGTLYEAIQTYLQRDTRFGRKLEIGMVQRLDRDTSGLIIFSIHPRSHKGLSQQFQQRSARKIYLALVEGIPGPEEGEFRSQLARNRTSGKMKNVAKGGKEAVTRYRVLDKTAEMSLVEVELITGRMHQIRAHFSEAGYPLLGDRGYGGKKRLGERHFQRQCLHSHRLTISHPVHRTELRFEAPVPADMQFMPVGALQLQNGDTGKDMCDSGSGPAADA